ncbi:hypothetical protein C0431_09545 [bacterium]|nr:hypothetical protein [bacterium]
MGFSDQIDLGKTECMANCYICGRPLNESRTRLRRNVKTGEWVRRDYRTGKPMSVQKRFGTRIVCQGCAKWIDARDLRSARWQWIQLGLALVVVGFLLIAT